jgi:hypothetical protein
MTTSAKHRMTVKPGIIGRIRAAKTGPDLHEFLQAAVKLEHATIPPYLTAWFSLRRGTNLAAAQIVRSVVKQEMLHMTIAANILNAIDGTPGINRPDFIPTYPGTLPMSVDDGMIVGLAPLSKDLVETVFMRIELPEHPQDYKVLTLQAGADEYGTIGQFYDAIIAQIKHLGDGIFKGDPARQVVDPVWFPADQLFPITNVDTAVAGIEVIKIQGEGTTADPLSPYGVPAHYYRFEEIVKGRRLIVDPSVPEGYSFSGAPVPFDAATVIPLQENSKLSDYKPGTLAYAGVRQANYTYTAMLNALHDTFDGQPDRLRTAIALMYELKLVVDEKVTNQKLDTGKFAAPSFEFTPEAATNPLLGRASSLVASA